MSEWFLPKDAARIKAARIQKAALALEKGVKAEAEKASDVITVKYGAIGDAETPACVLQSLGKLYLEKHLQLRRPVGSTNFFAEQTEKYRQELANFEGRLTNFSREEGVQLPMFCARIWRSKLRHPWLHCIKRKNKWQLMKSESRR